MPVFHEITGRLNDRFRHGNIGEIDISPFLGEASLVQIVADLGIVGDSKSIDHQILGAIPQGMQAALKALVVHNLSRDEPWEMTFAWAPGYDYELTVWEAPSTVVSRAGITVLLRTRYPADPHPSDLPLT